MILNMLYINENMFLVDTQNLKYLCLIAEIAIITYISSGSSYMQTCLLFWSILPTYSLWQMAFIST